MSERPRVFVSRIIPDAGLDAIAAACEMDLWREELPPPRDELLRRVAGRDGILTLLTDRVDDGLLDAAGPQLKVVSNYAVGFDNIDVALLPDERLHGADLGERRDAADGVDDQLAVDLDQ